MPVRSSFSKTILICILGLACSTTWAEDLSTILNLALDVDTNLQQARDNKFATMELLPQTRAGLLPTVTGTANTQYNNTNNPLLLRYNMFSVGATLSQQVFNVTNWQLYRQSDIKIKAAIANYEDSIQDLVLRVVTQYFAILKAIDDLNFAVSERKAFARSLEETQQKFDAGVIAITDVNEAQAKYDGARAQEIMAINEVSNQKEQMGEITGVPAGNISLLKDSLKLHEPQPANIEHWVQTAVQQNFAVQSKVYEAESARKDISIQRAAHYPTIEADGSTSRGKSTPVTAGVTAPIANSNSIGLTLTLPIFTGGKIMSKTRQAEYQYRIALEAAVSVQRQTVSNVRQAYRGVLTQISQVKALQQSVISSKSALDATQAAFEVGTRTIVDVLNSKTDLLRAISNLSKARYDYVTESFKLKRYSGILSIQDANVVNTWLLPAPRQIIDPTPTTPYKDL